MKISKWMDEYKNYVLLYIFKQIHKMLKLLIYYDVINIDL